MAVVPKHEDQNARYDPKKDFTGDQMHRFTEVANKAQRRKEALETKRSAFSSVKEKAMRPIITPKKDKFNSFRYAVWLIVACAIGLWTMYMTGTS
ncbi:hypothetical protein [Vibrio marisflavi]|uniref:Uncharacterized protein n=1 Tax=Vibrio marisflavi CECT 7928 TaxID=634439 RepID=A0ABM9A0B6_9VIBR|nr:hypothetical protein [Vibrio marisflavi]CAH0536305.1 hypothetical protein VMF7928_00320 [Vibrio marisflavi CECT 7928]